MILGMAAAGAVFRATRLVTLSRLAAMPASNIFTRGLAPRMIANAAGFFAEVPSFTAAVRVVNHALGREQDGSASGLGRELAAGAVTLFGLKIFGGLSGMALRGLNGGIPAELMGANRRLLSALLPQIGNFFGIVCGHRLEESLHLRPRVEGANWITDGLAALLNLNVGGRLAREALGAGLRQWEGQLDRWGELIARGAASSPAPEAPQTASRQRIAGFWRNIAFAPLWMMMGVGGPGGGEAPPRNHSSDVLPRLLHLIGNSRARPELRVKALGELGRSPGQAAAELNRYNSQISNLQTRTHYRRESAVSLSHGAELQDQELDSLVRAVHRQPATPLAKARAFADIFQNEALTSPQRARLEQEINGIRLEPQQRVEILQRLLGASSLPEELQEHIQEEVVLARVARADQGFERAGVIAELFLSQKLSPRLQVHLLSELHRQEMENHRWLEVFQRLDGVSQAGEGLREIFSRELAKYRDLVERDVDRNMRVANGGETAYSYAMRLALTLQWPALTRQQRRRILDGIFNQALDSYDWNQVFSRIYKAPLDRELWNRVEAAVDDLNQKFLQQQEGSRSLSFHWPFNNPWKNL